MEICVNGQIQKTPDNLTLEGLLACLGVEAQGTAIERNHAVVPHSLFKTTFLCEGDRIEIIRFVGGG